MSQEQADITAPVRLRDRKADTALLEPRDTDLGPKTKSPPGHLPGQRRNPLNCTITSIARPARSALEKDGVQINVPVGAGAIKMPDREVRPQVDAAVRLVM